ncbi:hypothetical protein NQK81_35405 [Amycolatopsis roodepoortensis]|uniref:hypothetical protein n=1 Tax=Amycolatopsis roodepoortensis TaxID=700274 RepID=UPI00214C7E9B|nr:hypothetical protein [Amycolatopsis roodepoortensis]UUV30010.1 hypothetical protein NQK81_35405 [Amycolatopsis roodepoortensis]
MAEDELTSLADHRRQRYAVHTVALDDGAVPGAASLFDTALTNGLLAIVEAEWPGETANARGFTKPASQLLTLIRDKIGSNRWIVTTLPAMPFPPDDRPTPIEVDLAVLEQAVTDTQSVRHGKAGGATTVPLDVVRALQELDFHDALSVLSDARIDQVELAEATAAAVEYDRVATYIELIGDEELARRADQASDALPFDPKERHDSAGIGLCPMCGHEALVISHVLEYGSEIGTCFACSHTVTEASVSEEEFSAMLRSHGHE